MRKETQEAVACIYNIIEQRQLKIIPEIERAEKACITSHQIMMLKGKKKAYEEIMNLMKQHYDDRVILPPVLHDGALMSYIPIQDLWVTLTSSNPPTWTKSLKPPSQVLL